MIKILRLAIIGLAIAAAVTLFGGLAYATAQDFDGVVRLGTANTVVLRGEINEKSTNEAALKLLELSRERLGRNYPIYLVLDSPGGSVEAGEAFIEVAKMVPNLHTVTVFAASMASAIVEALPGDRLILDSGVLMFHRARGGVQGQFETGELETRLDFYKKFVRRMEQRSADRMGMSLKEYKKRVKDEMWLTSKESLELNAADRVVSVTCSQQLIEQKQTTVEQVFIFTIKLEFSGCPILRTPKVSQGQPEQAVQAYEKYRGLKWKRLLE